MLRTIWAAFVGILASVFFAVAVLCIAALRSTSQLIDGLIRLWARIVVKGAGIDLHAEGTELVDRQQRAVPAERWIPRQ